MSMQGDVESAIENNMETLAAIQKELREIRETRERRVMPPMNDIKVSVDASGAGVLITTAAACIMLGVVIMGSLVLAGQRSEINDLRDYLSAIYMQAPHLKPPDYKED